MPYINGPYLTLEIPNEDTGLIEKKYVSVPELFNRIWEDYIMGMIQNEYTRGLLSEIGLTPCEVFHMMEKLQGGKAEFDLNDYRGRSYV